MNFTQVLSKLFRPFLDILTLTPSISWVICCFWFVVLNFDIRGMSFRQFVYPFIGLWIKRHGVFLFCQQPLQFRFRNIDCLLFLGFSLFRLHFQVGFFFGLTQISVKLANNEMRFTLTNSNWTFFIRAICVLVDNQLCFFREIRPEVFNLTLMHKHIWTLWILSRVVHFKSIQPINRILVALNQIDIHSGLFSFLH
jgi:hypothetical protein